MLHGQLRRLADGVRALEQGFKAAWPAAWLGKVELPPRGEASDELYLIPCLRAWTTGWRRWTGLFVRPLR